MFTGIILAMGKIVGLADRQGDSSLSISTGKLSPNQIQIGDSVAVDGVCLTAVAVGKDYFCVDVSRETLECTTLQAATKGKFVNLELAITPATRMGGHIVSGHIDGIGTIIAKRIDARCYRFTITFPKELQKYIAGKASICIDGISLTINVVKVGQLEVNIIPHTMQVTTLGQADVGGQVNLEVDLLARYMQSLLQDQQQNPTKINKILLQQAGFLKD